MGVILTIDEAKQHPADFLYVFASDEFLAAIPQKYAKVIIGKKANQNKILLESAKANGSTRDAYTEAIYQAFQDTYGMKPAEALIILAQGGNVAGNNWSEGTFGIGSVSASFKNVQVNDQAVTVDAKTGHIFVGATDVTNTKKTVYTTIKGETVPYQLFSDELGDLTFMSQYNKTMKKYYAQSYVNGEGVTKNYLGTKISSADGATIWGDVILSVQTFVQWLLSIFGISTDTTTELINSDNTLPNQKTDGFVYESGFGEAGAILLALAAGGAVLAKSRQTKTAK